MKTPEAKKNNGDKTGIGLEEFFFSLTANRIKLMSQINATTEKYEQVEDEGREIQCSDGEEIRYYDKHGNYIMSEREYEEEDDEESDESVDEDEEAILTTCAALKIRIDEKSTIDDSQRGLETTTLLKTPAKSNRENKEITEEYIPPSFESLSLITPSSKPFILKLRPTPFKVSVHEQMSKPADILDVGRNLKSENSYSLLTTSKSGLFSSESSPTTTVNTPSTKKMHIVKLFSPRFVESKQNLSKKPRFDPLMDLIRKQ